MNLLEMPERVRGFLERNGRISLRALCREFRMDADEFIGELADG